MVERLRGSEPIEEAFYRISFPIFNLKLILKVINHFMFGSPLKFFQQSLAIIGRVYLCVCLCVKYVRGFLDVLAANVIYQNVTILQVFLCDFF